MNQLKNIRTLLNSIIDDTQSIEKNISQLEVDIIKDKVRELYQLINQLKPEVISETVPEVHNAVKQAVIENIKVEIQPEIIKIEESHKEIEVKETTPDLFSTNEKVRIADKYANDKISINDRIAEKKSTSIADKFKHKKADDIKSLIGINEKFLFINELFEGDMSEYNKFIASINEQTDLGKAKEFLLNEKNSRNWKSTLSSLEKLEELIQSKFEI